MKAANLLLSFDMNIKLCDFGLSRDMDLTARSGFCSGTPAYMAPELWRAEQMDLYKCDIYAFGIVRHTYTFFSPRAVTHHTLRFSTNGAFSVWSLVLFVCAGAKFHDDAF